MISFLQKIETDGGPKNFQRKFFNWLISNNVKYDFCDDLFELKKIIFVNAGSKRILYLLIQKLLGAKIIQRLDGFNDLKEMKNSRFKIKIYLSNLSMNFIRKYLANKIIYQSLFVKERWEKKYGISDKNSCVIHNAYFSRKKQRVKKSKKFSILIMEGNVQDNDITFKLLKCILEVSKINTKIENIYVLGNTNEKIKNLFIKYKKLKFMGFSSKEKLEYIIKKNKLIYFPIEFNASCPNSLIELTSYGIPSCFLDNGSLSELSKFSSIKIKCFSINLMAINSINNVLNRINIKYSLYSELSFLLSRRYNNNLIFKKYIDFIQT